jgi:hypothetical protein
VPYISGFCSIGAHEGTAPKNVNGRSVPTCKMPSDRCSCKCHKDLDEMFSMAEMERITVDKSGYVPDRSDFVMPDLAELAATRIQASATVALEHIESPDPTLIPSTLARSFVPTPTGRSARGELEYQVDVVCKMWLIDKPWDLCLPKYISEEIARTTDMRPPSVGAIGAVFDRWVALGYAVCERKPVRFVGFTELGRDLGLDGLKQRARLHKVRTP